MPPSLSLCVSPFPAWPLIPAPPAPDSLSSEFSKQVNICVPQGLHACCSFRLEHCSLHSVSARLLPCPSLDLSVNMASPASSPRPLRLGAAPCTFLLVVPRTISFQSDNSLRASVCFSLLSARAQPGAQHVESRGADHKTSNCDVSWRHWSTNTLSQPTQYCPASCRSEINPPAPPRLALNSR